MAGHRALKRVPLDFNWPLCQVWQGYLRPGRAAKGWQPQEPPVGPGYQLWETTSEGSPMSPVFATLAELAAWFGQHGLNAAKMTALMQSKDVTDRMTRARAFMVANRVSGTPTLVVNGKYVVRSPRLEDRMRVVDALIAMERAAAAPR